MDTITQVLDAQRRFSAWNLDVRLDALRALFDEIKASQPQICEALKQDLGKTEFESVATETSIVLEELSAMIRKLPLYASVKKVATSMWRSVCSGKSSMQSSTRAEPKAERRSCAQPRSS